jgi:hypothetical protein
MLSNISDLFTMASLVICMLLSGIIFYYLRTRISMLEQSVMDQAQLLQQVVTSLKSSQYRQQMNPSAHVAAAVIQQQQQQQQQQENDGDSIANHTLNQRQINLIQVSDDDSDASSDDSDSDSESSDYDNTVGENSSSCSKIIDLSLTANYYKPSSHSEIKVIELTTSKIHSNHGGTGGIRDDDEDDDEDDDDDEYSDDDGDEYSDDDGDGDGDGMSDGEGEVHRQNKENYDNNSSVECVENQHVSDDASNSVKKNKSIIIDIEDNANSISLDEMKNMPVNSLRSLAKNRLGNIDLPTINKMSKKEILKALHD